MHSANIRQTFALNNEGIITSIRDVERGSKCNCICPSCKANLIAKQGKIREWHFAHSAHHNCTNGAESSLHLAAKQVAAHSSKISIPSEDSTPEYLLIESAELEMSWDTDYGRMIPDVCITSGSEIYFVEIIVTHTIDEQKREKINSLGVPTLLIYLDPCWMAEWSWIGLIEHVIDGTINRQWLSINDKKETPFLHETPVNPNEIFDRQASFLIEDVQVSVRRYEWFVTVKSMYDEHVNKLLISMSHKFNGYWNSVYKTCTYPRYAYDDICDYLDKLMTKNSL